MSFINLSTSANNCLSIIALYFDDLLSKSTNFVFVYDEYNRELSNLSICLFIISMMLCCNNSFTIPNSFIYCMMCYMIIVYSIDKHIKIHFLWIQRMQ